MIPPIVVEWIPRASLLLATAAAFFAWHSRTKVTTKVERPVRSGSRTDSCDKCVRRVRRYFFRGWEVICANCDPEGFQKSLAAPTVRAPRPQPEPPAAKPYVDPQDRAAVLRSRMKHGLIAPVAHGGN